jgi:hypothetical protein
MGVERAVTRWHLQEQTIQQEIIVLQTRLEKLPVEVQASNERKDLAQKIEEAHQRLIRLGPCPQAMMG